MKKIINLKYKKSIILITVIILLINFKSSIYANYIEKNTEINIQSNETQNEIENKKKAIIETANAYYRKKTNIQYCSYRKTFGATPEDATPDNNTYTVCSSFIYQVYKQALGIEMPLTTSALANYAKKYENTNYVVGYYNSNQYIEKFNPISQKNSPNGYKEFVSKICKELEIGDVLVVVQNTGGHAMLVTSIIDDNNDGMPEDVCLMHAWGKNFEKNSNADEIEYYKSELDNSTIEGAIRLTKLSILFKSYVSDVTSFSIIRPLGSEDKFLQEDNKEVKYKKTDSAYSRIKYEGIDIEKTSSAHTKNLVNLGDEIEYSIRITNNGTKKYKGICVQEDISQYVEIIDNNNGLCTNNTIKWEDIDIKPGEEKTITYKIRVKQNVDNLGKIIISTGKVDNITSATIENQISNVLTMEEKQSIIDISKRMLEEEDIKQKSNLIDYIYIKALNVDINTNNINVNSLLDANNNLIDNAISNMVRKNLYGRYNITIQKPSYNYGAEYYDKNNITPKILVTNLQIGDIILIEENNIDKSYLYLGETIIGVFENTLDFYETKDEIEKFISSLITKDGFIIISPAQSMPRSIYDKDNEILDISENLNLVSTIYPKEDKELKDTTIATTKIPYAGTKNLFIIIVLLTFVSLLFYHKLKKYKQ